MWEIGPDKLYLCIKLIRLRLFLLRSGYGCPYGNMYLDLGESVDVQEELNRYAEKTAAALIAFVRLWASPNALVLLCM